MFRVACVVLCFAVSSAFIFHSSGSGSSSVNSCSRYLSMNCNEFGHDKECGTDGTTYDNRCAFTQAKCRGQDIHVAHKGECTGLKPTGPPLLTGEKAIQDFFCLELAHENCPGGVEKICGTDGFTYLNMCEYEKARCMHRELHVRKFGECTK
ncbi:agrin-like isoform X2 [Gigantopelta aegis]|uniref:agrin-like isoform X2 n=1 Tax=Gigantopelta aegis TaxID=1735272 RepID=UPI001B88E697|nr:agrin-like isoform X2 [Gigantopelta aegis]